MPRISITRIHDQTEASSALLTEVEHNLQSIQCRAFDYFQQRGEVLGDDLGDWLRAEREVVWKPNSEMFENDFAIVLRVAVPGFDPKSIQVTAAPYSLVIRATDTHTHHGLEARLRFCEFGQKLFRSFDLAARIDPKTVLATLDKGILEIVANKARQPAAARKPPVTSSQGDGAAKTASGG
jgi:HSP20 family molecular chaperone IbpA